MDAGRRRRKGSVCVVTKKRLRRTVSKAPSGPERSNADAGLAQQTRRLEQR
jgi:hypothetical protein